MSMDDVIAVAKRRASGELTVDEARAAMDLLEGRTIESPSDDDSEVVAPVDGTVVEPPEPVVETEPEPVTDESDDLAERALARAQGRSRR